MWKKNRSWAINIEITRPELQDLIQRSLRATGLSKPEDVIFEAMREFDAKSTPRRSEADKFGSLAELLLNSPFAGAGLDLERVRDYPRDVVIK
jgi:hypothetical protein